MFDVSLSVDQSRDDTVEVLREEGQLRGKVLRHGFRRTDTAFVEFFECFDLTRLEAVQLTVNFSDGRGSSLAVGRIHAGLLEAGT